MADVAAADPSDDLDIAAYRKMFAEARDLLADNRREQQIDDDYYHGYQLTKEERDKLRLRKQPDTVFNRFRRAINGTLGVLEGGQSDPRAYGRNPGVDEDAADVVTKTLRFAADLNDFEDLRLECAYDYLVPGSCAALVEVDEDRRPKLTQIHWEEFFYDPRSRKRDFSDARYMGIAKWMYADQIAALYPDNKTDIEDAVSGALTIDETFGDRPAAGLSSWVDRRNRRLMVVEIYHRRDGQWNRCVFHAGGILASGVSEYLDDKKRPDCAIVAQSCYVDRENNRIGIGRDMRSPQDEFNKRRQKLLHMLNNRQVQSLDPNIALQFDADLVRAEAARPDGVIPPGWQPTSQNDLASGQFNLLTLAESEMDRQGPNPAILGRQAQDASGRAQQVRQAAGMSEDALIYKGVHSWEVRIYRAIWNRCRQFWTAPDYIRITDDEGAPQFIGINQPNGAQVTYDENGQPQLQPTYENALADLDVDIILETVPDTATLAQEQFQTLAQLAQQYGPQEVPFDDLLEVSDLPDKRKLIEKRKARQEQQGQMGQVQQQMQATAAQQGIRETAASATLKEAQAEEVQAKTALLGVQTQVQAVQPQLDAMKFVAGHHPSEPSGAPF